MYFTSESDSTRDLTYNNGLTLLKLASLRPQRNRCLLVRGFLSISNLTTMEDKNAWNGYGKPSFHILNLSNVQM